MSNVSNTHNVAKLEKNSKAFTGQRVARVIAKADKQGNYPSEHLKESKFVSVPTISPEFTGIQLTSLSAHIVGMLNDAQDSIIRDRVIDGATSINDDEISVDACIKYLDDAAKGNRISGEFISKWFMDTYADSAVEFIATLCQFEGPADQYSIEQLKTIETKVNVLSSMFAGFASGKYSPAIPQCKAMIKFGEFLTADNQDPRMLNYIAKAVEHKTKRENEMSADALGFGN